jgi:hypothetical protein
VAPVSYFFCASAPLPDAASTANAATEAIVILFAIAGIAVSLGPLIRIVCDGSLDRKLLVNLAV